MVRMNNAIQLNEHSPKQFETIKHINMRTCLG